VLDCYGRINLRSRSYQNEFGMAWCLEERNCKPWLIVNHQGNIIKILVNYILSIKFYEVNKIFII
jgi:hypothetical protein